jgi:diadenosine tetraphosphate (Ap4A) HIT family hydrolase
MDWKEDRISSAVSGENPTVLLQMKSGFAVMADSQFLPGYCILLGCPRSSGLNDLPLAARQDFLTDMTLVGDAITEVCRPLRVNYEILGNTDSYLHAHIIPRYPWEADTLRRQPVWLYPREYRTNPDSQFSGQKHGELKRRITVALRERIRQAYAENSD